LFSVEKQRACLGRDHPDLLKQLQSLFLALLPVALSGDEEHQRAIVREMKVVLYRYWEPIMETQRASDTPPAKLA
jgi:hypothetical protein